MRKGMWAALLLGLALVTPARAQTSLFGGVDPTRLIYTPVDTSRAQVPVASPQQTGFTNFNLRNLFPNHSISMGNGKVLGASHYPTQAQLPGQNWLDAFNFQRPLRKK